MVQFNPDEVNYGITNPIEAPDLIKKWEERIEPWLVEDKLVEAIKKGLQAYRYRASGINTETKKYGHSYNKLFLITPPITPMRGFAHTGWNGVWFEAGEVRRVEPSVGIYPRYEDSYINIQDAIFPHELIARWSGLDEMAIAAMVNPFNLPGYELDREEQLQAKDGTAYYRCLKNPVPEIKTNMIGGEWRGYWDRIVFKKEDVEEVENRPGNEYYRDRIVSVVDGGGPDDGEATFPCDKLHARWGKSSFKVMDVLNSANLGIVDSMGQAFTYRLHNPSDLQGLYIHELDLQEWERENLRQGQGATDAELSLQNKKLQEQVQTLLTEKYDLETEKK